MMSAAVGLCVIAHSARADSLDVLMRTCAPNVHPVTLGAIVRTESRGHAYVLSDDGPNGLPWSERKKMLRSFYPDSVEEAETIATKLIAANHRVGIGLAQVNSSNLASLGLTVRTALDPCTNLRAGAQILTANYRAALKRFSDEQDALLAAISAYNTGDFSNGFTNGYVGRVVDATGFAVPALRTSTVPRTTRRLAAGTGNILLSKKIAVLRATIEE
ncbi:lytic transglycosylase, catalytic [Pandoraea cepalis]|uniref:Lytic transglycosylase, catalytic n=2 Tax=Pandoraea cepalis TaxID=2508294 RepID=A0AAW7MGY3_9BURK|nr:lytic transglycosylase, catalytic [Pandoraea cepalis]MDN4576675.1 lytic transglycosylase, catalytic [Pandoraea cepalis]